MTVRLPPGPSAPRLLQGAYALAVPGRGMRHLANRYGDAFTVNIPIFGRAVVISNPAEVRELFLAGQDLVDNLERNLGRVLGSGSLFALSGEEHRTQRRLLVPPFHGRRLAAYERIVEAETVRELASWPENTEFATLPSMMRITLNAILRAVFGAEGAEFSELRELLPRFVVLGSRLAVLPISETRWGRLNPWRRFRAMRREYDAIVARLIARAEHDPGITNRDDVLSLMLRSRYDDGSAMSHTQIADQLLTLLTAGHETTATTLAWAVERLRRHPDVLRKLVGDQDAGGSAYREATIVEVQRSRPVIDMVGRQVTAEEFKLGRWTLPKGCPVLVSIALMHNNESIFPNGRPFNPSRFLDAKPDLYQWIPFGGGVRRCLGAAFANMEMNVVLRIMLRDFTLVPTSEPGERWHWRGVANAPAKGGLAVVRPRGERKRAPRRLPSRRGGDSRRGPKPAERSEALARRKTQLGAEGNMSERKSLKPIAGRPVMITGAASGIGRALAQRLARYGSPVAIADIDETGLKQTAASLPAREHLTRVLDVADADDLRRFAGEVRDWLPEPLAAVFNNAGVGLTSTVLDAMPEDDDWLHQINFHGVVNGTRAFLPILMAQHDGVIVNTSSVFGLVGIPYQSAYCAAKFAVRGFTDSLRQELRGTGVRAVTVHPGGVTTNIARNARIRTDPEGLGRTKEQMVAQFEAMTMTRPEKAAAIIHRGVERGKARILVGPDAYLFDALARVAPVHYYDVLRPLTARMRRRS